MSGAPRMQPTRQTNLPKSGGTAAFGVRGSGALEGVMRWKTCGSLKSRCTAQQAGGRGGKNLWAPCGLGNTCGNELSLRDCPTRARAIRPGSHTPA
eukprot:scaffold16163_cov106-Isochrysis_galbana.AAC.7